MIEIILSVGVGVFIVYASFSISNMMSMKRASAALEEFIKRTETNVNDTLIELKGTLENVRKITDNISAVTEEVKQISHTVVSLEKRMRNVYGYIRGGVGSRAGASLVGLKVGIKTGVARLVKNVQNRKEGLP